MCIGKAILDARNWWWAFLEHVGDQVDEVSDIDFAIIGDIGMIRTIRWRTFLEHVVDQEDQIGDVRTDTVVVYVAAVQATWEHHFVKMQGECRDAVRGRPGVYHEVVDAGF